MRTRPLAMPTLVCNGLPLSSRSSDGCDSTSVEPGVDSALRRVFARMRIAEIGKHAIAQIPGDKAVQLVRSHPRNSLRYGAHDFMKLFRVEAGGNRGRSDKIAEEDGEMPALDAAVGTLVQQAPPGSGSG